MFPYRDIVQYMTDDQIKSLLFVVFWFIQHPEECHFPIQFPIQLTFPPFILQPEA